MTADQILAGTALTVVLAVGSQVLAGRLRIPALIVLLPAGFTAGALTDVVHPDQLIGAAFPELVSLAVALILYDAGLALDLRHLAGHTGRVVTRLIWLGTLITWGLATVFAALLLGMSHRAAVMLGAILVVSGPTVVGPLLGYVRPVRRLQRILVWEGSLIDPVGAILGALVFHVVLAGHGRWGSQLLAFARSIGVGLLGGAVGAAMLWLLLRRLRLGETLGSTAQLATVIGVAAVCDIVRDDTGLIAAIVMGLAVANLSCFDAAGRRPFFETLISLVLGLLFVSISATVTPESLRHLLLPTLALLALLVLVVRPLVAAVSTYRTDLPWRERAFVGWMAPRGIVAASTASAFSATLVARGIGGAAKILPVTFLVIVATVTLYGLSAVPVARRLDVVRPALSRPLLVGGDPWVIDLGLALRSAGLDVLVWAGGEQQREAVRRAGLRLAEGELLATATGEGARLEGITTLLLLTAEDDFNALAATVLRGSVDGAVLRLGPPAGNHCVVAPFTGGDTLFGPALTRPALAARYRAGARVTALAPGTAVPPGHDLLCLVHPDGRLEAARGPAPATPAPAPAPETAPGVIAVTLPPAGR